MKNRLFVDKHHRTLLGLSASMRSHAKNAQRFTGNRAKKLIGWRIFQLLVSGPPIGTPVDTSRALSNWRVMSAYPITTAREPYYFGSRGSTAGASRMEVLKHGITGVHASPVAKTLQISNLVDYIEDLEMGASRQSPPGWISRAVQVGKQQGMIDYDLGVRTP